jgi:hypothetical protein
LVAEAGRLERAQEVETKIERALYEIAVGERTASAFAC